MSEKITLKGTVDKVVRQNGKTGATMMILIPLAKANEIPLGIVNISIEEAQGALFPEAGKPAKPVRVRGDRG